MATIKIINLFSPNFEKNRRSNKYIKSIVLHYTGMQSERESLYRLCDSASKVSSHYLINKKGKVYRLVYDHYIAWHAGKSCWGENKNLNKNSIGIELVNKGHEWGYEYFNKKQILTLVKICKKLIKKYKIKNKNIVGHSDIAPDRKIDPGEKFPWKHLASHKIGMWHTLKPEFLKKKRGIKLKTKKDKKIFINNLKKIGYCFRENKNKVFFKKTLKAFQRHYRKELINGLPDQESFLIAENLSKKL